MKTKHKSCVAAAVAAAGASEKMKSVILYPYGPLTGTGCCRMLHAKNLAITSAIYTINIALLIVLIYAWRINVNINKSSDLEDVYYGVQVAYFAIIGTQMSMIVLSIMLVFGIYKENPGLIVPWIIGYITFMALEAVAMVYSNVLRDHVNKQFDAMCKAEVAFFIARAFINVLAMWGVLRFYNLVRAGITWKGPEAKTTTYHQHNKNAHNTISYTSNKYQQQYSEYSECRRGKRRSAAEEQRRNRPTGCCFFDFDDYDDDEDGDDYDDDVDYEYGGGGYGDCAENGSAYDDDFDDDENDDEEAESSDCTMLGATPTLKRTRGRGRRNRRHGHQQRPRNNNIRSVLINKRHNKYKIAHPQTRLEVINESERSAGSGSDEQDSLLVGYDSQESLASV